MFAQSTTDRITRRRLLQAAAIAPVGLASVGSLATAQNDQSVRDKLWVFTCVAGSDDDSLKRGNFPRMSRMTPAESALYLNVPNLMMIRWEGKPEIPFDQYAIPFRPLKRLVWSLVDSGGVAANNEWEKAVFEFAARTSNLTGFILDDFFAFAHPQTGKTQVLLEPGDADPKVRAALSLEELRALRNRLVIGEKRRDLYVVVYHRQLHPNVKPYLELCDKITYWTGDSKDLVNLEKDFSRLEKIVPDRPKLLGCYFWDYTASRPVPLELMQKQCRAGLEWLREGRIEGIIFLANTVADLDLPSVEWTRKWIAEVGNQPIAVKPPLSAE